jgi:integrase
MTILAECPICNQKQSVRNKICKCSAQMDKLKRNGKIRFWIDFRVPGGKQRREPIGFSLNEAKNAESKRRVQKRERRFFEMLPESNITFTELIEWYLELDPVKGLSSFRRIEAALSNFADFFGKMRVRETIPLNLENYQVWRAKKGAAPATIDMELSLAATMVNKAFDNDLVDGRAIKAFRRVKRKLKPGSNARTRVLSIGEYLKLTATAPPHLKAIIKTAFNTGMRLGEILNLRWQHVDKENS